MKHCVKGLVYIGLFAVLTAFFPGCNSSEEPEGNLSCVVTRSCPPGYHCHAESGVCIKDTPCDLCDAASEICVDETCLKRCQTSSDCPVNHYCDLSLNACKPTAVDGDNDTDGDAVETAEPEEEVDLGPCASCGGNEVCYLAPGAEEESCLKRCNPYDPQCDNGDVCWLPFDIDALPMGEGLCAPPIPNGAAMDEACGNDTPCQLNLVCNHSYCRTPCNAWGEHSCPDQQECRPVLSLDIGLCMSTAGCDPATNPCPEGFVCLDGDCVPGTPCDADADCPGSMVCDFGLCLESCLYLGCPSHKPICNEQTGHCVRSLRECISGCPGGFWCNDGNCVADCDPPCEGRSYCVQTGGAYEVECLTPDDCRKTGNMCADPTRECDQRTGFCIKRCPANCAPPTCCDVSTDYQCGQCETGVCSNLNPMGPCPLMDQVCIDGQCKTDQNICVPAGMPCSTASTCCDANGEGVVDCCVNPTSPDLVGVCCGSGQTCLYVGSICL